MPHRIFVRSMNMTVGDLTQLVIAISGLVTAVAALAKVFHNTSRIASLEQGTGNVSDASGTATASEPEPSASGKG